MAKRIRTIEKKCPHCDPKSQAFKFKLEEGKNFTIVADVHPLIEGHILIIPKIHLSCAGEYSEELFREFQKLYNKVLRFLKEGYGLVSSFEHGKTGQSVFHAHTHLLPFGGKPEEIVPEGYGKLKRITSLSVLRTIYEAEGGYLFFSIGDEMWLVDQSLGKPRFFRDRFAAALGRPERGNWKEMEANNQLMSEANRTNQTVKQKWTSLAEIDYNTRIRSRGFRDRLVD